MFAERGVAFPPDPPTDASLDDLSSRGRELMQQVHGERSRQGYAAPDNPADHPFSLHATKALRLSVPGMKDLTAHFKELAKTHGGHYDGWSAAVVPHGAPRP